MISYWLLWVCLHDSDCIKKFFLQCFAYKWQHSHHWHQQIHIFWVYTEMIIVLFFKTSHFVFIYLLAFASILIGQLSNDRKWCGREGAERERSISWEIILGMLIAQWRYMSAHCPQGYWLPPKFLHFETVFKSLCIQTPKTQNCKRTAKMYKNIFHF